MIRLGLFLGYLLFGLLLALLMGSRVIRNNASQTRVIRWYCAGVCRILRLRISVAGPPPAQAAMVVSNHISWLDIPVLLACLEDASMLSKSEVRQWPLIGFLASSAGTLFIHRGGHQTKAVSREIAGELQCGRRVVVFPEGTTTSGRQVLPFHASLFGAPLAAGADVQPVLLNYHDQPGQPSLAPFVGDDDFVAHLCRVLAGPPISITIDWLAPIHVDVETNTVEGGTEWKAQRRSLAGESHARVAGALKQARCRETTSCKRGWPAV